MVVFVLRLLAALSPVLHCLNLDGVPVRFRILATVCEHANHFDTVTQDRLR